MKTLVFAWVACALMTGCVNRELVESYRSYRSRIGAEWLRYVAADPALGETDKRARQLLHEAAGRVIEEAGE